MSALSAAREAPKFRVLDQLRLPLNGGSIAYAGGMACLDTADGACKPGAAATTLVNVGVFGETVDNSAGSDGDKKVNVQLHRVVRAQCWLNVAGGNAVTAAYLGSDVYILDDQTVTIDATGHSKAGRCWGVEVIDGVSQVLVEAMAHAL